MIGTTIYYSQKTGADSGDSSVWNTVRGGGGSPGDPGQDDLRIQQTGHTISSGSDHVGSPRIIEDGSVWDKGSYHVQQKGSILNYAGSTGLVTSGGKVHMIKSGYLYGIPQNFFNGLVVADNCDVKVLNGSSIKEARPIISYGDLDATDGAVIPSGTGRIEVNNHGTLQPGTTSFSLFAIVIWDSATPGEGYIFDKLTTPGFELYYDGTKLVFTAADSVAAYSADLAFTPVAGKPYFILASRESSGDVYLWADEVLLDSQAGPPGSVDNSNDLILGNLDKGAGFAWNHEGTILDIRYWQGAYLDLDDLLDIMMYNDGKEGSSQKLWLKLDECTGDPEDSSGNSNDGDIEGSSVTWVEAEEFLCEDKLMCGPEGSLTLPDGIARSVIYQGTVTVPSVYEFEYRDRFIGLGSYSGHLVHTSYHTVAEDLEISDLSDMADNEVSKIDLSLQPNRTTKCDILVVDSPTYQNKLIGDDTITLEWASQTLFKGKLWRRAPKGGNLALLTFYDYLFDMRKDKVLRWLYGNIHQWKTATVTKAATPTISLSGFYSSNWHFPPIDITFLSTEAKNLRIDTDFYASVGYDGVTHQAASIYFDMRDEPGEILRLSVALGNLVGTDGGRLFYYRVFDMDTDSQNFDTAIMTGSIPAASIPVGATTYEWITIDLITAHGKERCPKRVKVTIGSVNITAGGQLECDWFGAEAEVFGKNTAKWGQTSNPLESNLDYALSTYDPGGINTSCGLALGCEVEVMGDWMDKRDPGEFLYTISTVTFLSTTKHPSFANETRRVSSSTWDIARISLWHDPPTVDSMIAEIWNDFGRYWFNQQSISVDAASVIPFAVIEDSDPVSLIERICTRYKGEIRNTFSGANIIFSAQSLVTESSWNGLSDSEQVKRTVALSEDLRDYPSLQRFLMEKYVKGSYQTNLEELVRQVICKGDTGKIPIISDYDNGEPYYSSLYNLNGDLDQMTGQAEDIMASLGDEYNEEDLDVVNIPIDSDELLTTTNELLKIMDGRHGFARLGKVETIRRTMESGEWKNKVKLTDPLNMKPGYYTMEDTKRVLGGFDRNIFPRNDNRPPLGGGLVVPEQSFDPENAFEIALELNSSYDNTQPTDWWLLLGSSSASPTSTTMQTSSASERLIVPAEVITLDSGQTVLYARVTEEHLQGEFVDAFQIREIGTIINVGLPSFTGSCETREVLYVPSVSATSFYPAFLSSGQVYRPYPWFLKNSVMHVSYGHIPP